MKRRILANAALTVLIAIATTESALALEVKKSVDIAAAPDAAWKAIGDFCGIGTWHPAVAKCDAASKDGSSMRTLTLKDGAKIVEKLSVRDEKAMSYGYTIVESPLPVANYQSTFSVSAKGAGSTILWTGKFDAKGTDDAKASDVISGIYDAGLASLVAKLK
ncbi:MAG: SRPBCC family protein [Hyphomicrobiaceae bacterium]